MCTIVKHGGNGTVHLSEGIVFHNDDGHTRHGKVLLCTSVNAVILSHIDRTAEDVGRHITNLTHWDIQINTALGSVDSIVARRVEIIYICRNLIIFRDERVICIGRRSNFDDFAKQLGFFHGFLCPRSRVQVSSFFAKEVVRHHAKLQRGAASEEEYGIAFRNLEQFLYQSFSFVHDRLEILCAMTDLCQRKTTAIEI